MAEVAEVTEVTEVTEPAQEEPAPDPVDAASERPGDADDLLPEVPPAVADEPA